VLLVLVGGCSNAPAGGPPTIAPAEPAVSPPVTTRPAGDVRPLAGHPVSAVFDPVTASLVVFGPGPDGQAPGTVTMLPAATGAPRTVALPGPATALAGDGKGHAFLSARGGYYRVDLQTAAVTRIAVTGQDTTDFTAVARRDDGRLVLGSADGAVYTLRNDNEVAATVKIFARVDSVVTQKNTAVVLDRGQTSVTTIDPSGDRAAQALRAGDGATTIATDPAGRVLVADTRGESLLVYGVDPLMLRQRSPVRQSPYGLVGSSRLVWVSQTASNSVVGYDLATGIPVEEVRYPTVRQPDSLAFDDATGTLYVVSSTGDGVQVIQHAAEPR
jgi:DNA-binding beta-propeller fold protein YncE